MVYIRMDCYLVCKYTYTHPICVTFSRGIFCIHFSAFSYRERRRSECKVTTQKDLTKLQNAETQMHVGVRSWLTTFGARVYYGNHHFLTKPQMLWHTGCQSEKSEQRGFLRKYYSKLPVESPAPFGYDI